MNLPELEATILTLHNEWTIRTSIDTVRRIGELLLEAKKQIRHGGFRSWLGRIGIRKTTASDYMRIARAGNVRTTGHMTIDGFTRMLRAGRRAELAERKRELAKEARTTKDPQIITGDALDWLKRQPDNSVPFFLSDPPFGLGKVYDGWTEPDNPTDYWRWLKPFWQEMTRVCMPGGVVALWQAYRHLPFLFGWFPKCVIIANVHYVRGNRIWEPIIK